MKSNVILSVWMLLLAPGGISRAGEPVIRDTLGFDSAVSVSPADLLSGKVSGVRVSETPGNPLGPVGIDVRGLNSLRGHNQPVYVIDGVIMGAPVGRSVDPFWNYPGFDAAEDLNPLAHIDAYDIESIRVLKDASATARYGSNGAGGVVVIDTRRRGFGENEAVWHSDIGALGSGDGLVQGHHLGLAGTKNASSYNISLSYGQYADKSLSKYQDRATLKVGYDNAAGRRMRFGFNTIMGTGNFSNGESSRPDYDDDGRLYSATASAHMSVAFTRWLSWNNTAGLDFRSFNRYFWYGSGTPEGLEYNGLASVVSHSGLSANVGSALEFNRYFGKFHHLTADAGIECQAVESRFNTMSGSDFFSHELRAKGLSSMNSANLIREYESSRDHRALYGAASYDYKGMAGLDLSLRADNTARYDDSDVILYPSLHVWADVGKALRLEGGWGRSGLEDSMPYAYIGDYLAEGVPEVAAGAEPYYEGLSRLLTTEWNVGATASLLSGRVRLGLKYYDRLTEDSFSVLCFGAVDDGYWKDAPRSEALAVSGTVAARGCEADASLVPVSTRDWKWTVSGNVAFNSQTDPGSILAYEVTSEGLYVDRTLDGHVTEADRLCVGNTAPSIYGGASTMLRFRRLTLDVLTDFGAGGKMVDYGRMASEAATRVTLRYVAEADWFKVSRVALKYDVPVACRWLEGLEVNVSGRNLLYETTLPGGYAFGSAVLRRMVLLGVKLEFKAL